MSDFYNKYPYTDFHELNLDWVIERVKKLTEDWLTTQEAWNNTQEQWQQLHDYVMDYFANLDVQDEINNKINAMIADGTFLTIVTPTINQTVVDTTTSWLAAHITQPTTPVVDNTLSIPGAAADSKTVGDKFDTMYISRSVASLTDLDNAIESGWYSLVPNTVYAHEPFASAGRRVLCTFKTASTLIYQICYEMTKGIVAYRYFVTNTWYSWTVIEDYFTNRPLVSTDLNDFTASGFTILNYADTYTNAPESISNTRRLLITYNINDNTATGYMSQMYVNLLNGKIFSRWYTLGDGWSNWIQHNDITPLAEQYIKRDVTGITDCDNMSSNGWYFLASGVTYTHQPFSTGQRILFVNSPDGGIVISQFAIQANTGIIATREKHAGTWDAWKDSSPYFTYRALPSADLNDFYVSGFYFLAYSTSYTNAPESGGSKRRVLICYNSNDNRDIGYQLQLYVNLITTKLYCRWYHNSVGWSAWTLVNEDLIIDEVTKYFAASGYTSSYSSANTGTKLDVMTYNVANYNNDTATYISDEQLCNIKKVLSKYKPDFLGIQEDREHLDSADTIDTLNTLYRPVFPYKVGLGGPTLYSKFSHTSSDILTFTNGRAMRLGYYTIGTKVLLFISVHPVADYNNTGSTSTESVNARRTQYEEMLKWIRGDITLQSLTTETAVSVSSFDYCIICGDMNTLTSTDRSNLASLCNTYSFTMANGGWMGWFNTNARGSDNPIDNILVSSESVIINAVETPEYFKSKLYSDHIPVYANVTLLE